MGNRCAGVRLSLGAIALLLCLALAGSRPAVAAPTPARDARPHQAGPLPLRLQIPSLHIDAPVEDIGEDDDGTMQSPSGPDSVGWFSPGFVPGTPGNAVMDGHVDWVDRAAVFWLVRQLPPGAEVDVLFDDGSLASFSVDQVVEYPDDDTPLDQIFAVSDTPHLNLITCDGVFDQASHNYDHRTVVYTTMTGSTPAPQDPTPAP